MTITIEQFLETYKKSVTSKFIKVFPQEGKVKFGGSGTGCFLALFIIPIIIYFAESEIFFAITFIACLGLFLFNAFGGGMAETINIYKNTIEKTSSKFYNVMIVVDRVNKIERQFVPPTENDPKAGYTYNIEFSGKATFLYDLVGLKFSTSDTDPEKKRIFKTPKLTNAEEIKLTEIFLNVFSNKINGGR